jgi:hypothetical protein
LKPLAVVLLALTRAMMLLSPFPVRACRTRFEKLPGDTSCRYEVPSSTFEA